MIIKVPFVYKATNINNIMGKSVLITVGTTQFQELIKFADTSSFVDFLKQLGYDQIIYQIGNKGEYIPKSSQYFRVSPQINDYYQQADLIITHGGAGTLLQNLLVGKVMIAVANNTLLHNHQAQLIEELHKHQYILGFSSVAELTQNLHKVKKFIEEGPAKKYTRPEKSLLNTLVFGEQK